mmetsp:Transcript_18007/g.50783  ORF Transcript_18007/g.50783 Transcript_18007/m.50783 type:complete len:442 (+) Transcript_18007:2217-3542(+)
MHTLFTAVLRRRAPDHERCSAAAFQRPVDAQRDQRAGHARQQVHRHRDRPETRRHAERDERRERGADQPGKVGGDGGTGVAKARQEIGADCARGLRVGQAEEDETDQHEGVEPGLVAGQHERYRECEQTDQHRQSADRLVPADAIGEQAGNRHRRRRKHRADHLHAEEVGHRLVREQVDPRDREHGDEVEQREAGQRHEGADDDRAALRAEEFLDAARLEFGRGHAALVLVGDDQAQACEQRDDVDREGGEERIAPAPVEEVFARQVRPEVAEQRRGDQEAQRCAELAEHRVPAAPVLRSVHRQQRRQAVPRGPQRHPLADAAHHQRRHCPRADALVSRQRGHAAGGQTEQEQRAGEPRAAPEAPLDHVAAKRAQRAHEEGQREQRERPQRAFEWAGVREEHRREHQRRGDAVDEEVEVLRGPADDHAHRDVAGRHRRTTL